jgi:hypothetical protein
MGEWGGGETCCEVGEDVGVVLAEGGNSKSVGGVI